MNISIHELAPAFCYARSCRAHISRLALLTAIRKGEERNPKGLYIGEIELYYHEHAKPTQTGAPSYSYAGIAQMLRRMHNDGMLTRMVEGRTVRYMTSRSGRTLLSKMGMIV